MELTIVVRVDPRQIQDLPVAGTQNRNKFREVWASVVTRTIRNAGFSAVIESGDGLDAYRDWRLMVGDHAVESRGGRMEGFDYAQLTASLLGACQCSGSPCPCNIHACGVVAGLLPVILRNAQLAVENALEQGEYAIEDASRGTLPRDDEEGQ